VAQPFNERLKELREKVGMTQEGLARASGLSVSSISKLEQRGIDPSWSTVRALAAALGVDCRAFEIEDASGPESQARKLPVRKKK
jgi:transcriptional regulator with XRE-family HTH domain